jgi:hypothetical protein
MPRQVNRAVNRLFLLPREFRAGTYHSLSTVTIRRGTDLLIACRSPAPIAVIIHLHTSATRVIHVVIAVITAKEKPE